MFTSEEHVEPFLKFMNSLHKNIEFTCEREESNKLSFIGVDVEISLLRFIENQLTLACLPNLILSFLKDINKI